MLSVGTTNPNLQKKPFLSETTGVKASLPSSVFDSPKPSVETSGTVASAFSGAASGGSSSGSSSCGGSLSCVA